MTTKKTSVEIDAATVRIDGKKQLMYNVAIGNQDSPYISLDELRELRRLCDVYIKLGEAVDPRMEDANSRFPESDDSATAD